MKHKIFICLFIMLFVSLNQLCLADDIENKIDYLTKLAEKNVDWANNLLNINIIIITVIALTFVSIIFFVIRQLKEMGAQIEVAKSISIKVEEHEKKILAIKNDIRDVDLIKRNITDDAIRKVIQENLGWKGTVRNVNIVKDFMWSENINDLNKIKELALYRELEKEINDRYRNEFKETIGMGKLLRWTYLIIKKDKNIDQLLNEEKESERSFQSALQAYMQYTYPGLGAALQRRREKF